MGGDAAIWVSVPPLGEMYWYFGGGMRWVETRRRDQMGRDSEGRIMRASDLRGKGVWVTRDGPAGMVTTDCEGNCGDCDYENGERE